jgi:hypothetical protein
MKILIFLLLSINLFCQEIEEKDKDYCPKNLTEAIAQLDIIHADSTKHQIISMSENEFLMNTHFTIGLWIRNEWLYDRFLGFNIGDSELREELFEMGVPTNDDMSGLILRSYYRHLTNQEINVEQQINDIQKYYLKINKLN